MLARKGGGQPITQEELRQKTGWGKKKVEAMCGLLTWASVAVGDADKFREACGVTRANERRHRHYLKRTLNLSCTTKGLAHFRKHPRHATTRLLGLLNKEQT